MANLERRRMYNRQYRIDNREAILKQRKEYRERVKRGQVGKKARKTKQELLETAKRYRINNRERINEKRRARRLAKKIESENQEINQNTEAAMFKGVFGKRINMDISLWPNTMRQYPLNDSNYISKLIMDIQLEREVDEMLAMYMEDEKEQGFVQMWV